MGQFGILNEARELFDIRPGNTLILLGDAEHGVANPPKAALDSIHSQNFVRKGSDEVSRSPGFTSRQQVATTRPWRSSAC